jgi:hypothetical protein
LTATLPPYSRDHCVTKEWRAILVSVNVEWCQEESAP